jgi:hypothetical protein
MGGKVSGNKFDGIPGWAYATNWNGDPFTIGYIASGGSHTLSLAGYATGLYSVYMD